MATPSHRAPLAELVEEIMATDGPLPIVAAGEPVLRRPTERYDGQLDAVLLSRFVEALRVTMHAAPGVGLAAPQIGVPLRIAVVEDPAEVSDAVRDARGRVPLPFRVLINPSYEPLDLPASTGPGRVAFFEEC